MFRYFLFILLVVSLCVPAYAQFGGRKFGQGNFGRFQFGIQKFENVDESVDGEDELPEGALMFLGDDLKFLGDSLTYNP